MTSRPPGGSLRFGKGARQRLRKPCCGASFPLPIDGSVAQLDRALASGARGRAFESRRAHSGSSAPASTSVGAGFSFGAPWIWDHPRVELRYATHLLKTPVPVPSGLGSGVIFGSPHDPEQKWRENELKRWRSWRPSSTQAELVNQRRHRMRRSLGPSRKRRGTCTERWWLPTRFQSAEPDFDRSSRGADRHLAHRGPSYFGRGAPQPSPRGCSLGLPFRGRPQVTGVRGSCPTRANPCDKPGQRPSAACRPLLCRRVAFTGPQLGLRADYVVAIDHRDSWRSRPWQAPRPTD